MTTPHQIGELLRTGVRPTEEEIEHLSALGGFAAEMLRRYLDGRTTASLADGSDRWSERLSSRLAASTAERWQHGFGLADMLLDNGLGTWWDVSRTGFATGYEGFDPEMEVLSLFEDEVPEVAVAADGAPVARRRRSLFGAKQASPPRGRLSPVKLGRAGSRKSEPQELGLTIGPVVSPAGAEGAGPRLRAGRWLDGGFAELTVLRALAAGGLPLADQVVEVLDGMAGPTGTDSGADARVSAGSPPRTSNWRSVFARQRSAGIAGARPTLATSGGGRDAFRLGVNLDGMRVDERTPALAVALERAGAVFSRAGTLSPAVNAERIEGMTSAVKVSIDRGLGAGERPVFGFYDAVESTFLSIVGEADSQGAAARGTLGAGEGATIRSARLEARSPGARSQTSQAAIDRQSEVAGVRPRGLAPVPAVALDSIVRPVAGRSPLRPLTTGVFAAPGAPGETRGVGFTSATSVEAPSLAASAIEGVRGGSVRIATQVRYTPEGMAMPSVERSAVGAPRFATRALLGPSIAARGRDSALDRGTPALATTAGSLGTMAESTVGFDPLRELVEGRSTWRLAADGGPDMPLGSSFSRAEVFGATHAVAHATDIRAARGDFRSFVAQPREEAAARANRLAGVLDGLVWVSTPSDSVAEQATASLASASSAARLPMATVPRGRSVAMVPAGSALVAIAQAALGERARAEQSVWSASLGPDGRTAGQAMSSANQVGQYIRAEGAASGPALAADAALSVVPPSSARTVAGRQPGTVASITSLLRSGVLSGMGPASSSVGGIASVVNSNLVGGLSASAMRQVARSMVERESSLASPMELLASANTVAERAPGAALMPAMRAIRGGIAGGGPSFTDGDESIPAVQIGSRWLESVVGDAATPVGLSRAVARAIASGYQRLDYDRVILSVGDEIKQVAAFGTDIKSASSPERLGAARMLGDTSSVGIAGVQRSPARIADTGGASRLAGPGNDAAAARQALLRPVVTARETRAVARAFGTSGVIVPVTPFGSKHGGFVRGASAIAQEAAAQGAMAPSAYEPVLSRLVSETQSLRSNAGLAAQWNVDVGMIERIASLGTGARTQLARSLSNAGWTTPELRMLSLAPAEQRLSDAGATLRTAEARRVSVGAGGGQTLGVAQTARDGGPALESRAVSSVAHGERGAEFAALRAPSSAGSGEGASTPPLEAQVGRMGQNLARVIGGAEALGASVSDDGVGSAGRAAARMQASAWLPLLGSSNADKYFGGMAPSTTLGTNALSLHDAVGELVKMAEVAAAQSDTAVSVEARREILRRVDGVRTKVLALAAAAPASAVRVTNQGVSVLARGYDSSGPIRSTRGALERGLVGGDLAEFAQRPEISGGVDADLVARTVARGVMDSVVADRVQAGARGVMRVPEAEMAMVGLEPADRGETTGVPGTMSVPSGIERRLAEALALSASGPAGARRLVSPLARGNTKASSVAAAMAPRLPGRRGGAAAEGSERISEPGIERAKLQLRREGGLSSAAVREEAGRALPVGLGKVLAPEVMLSGLRSAELVKAMDTVASRQAMRGWDAVGVLTTLSDAGIDLGAARSSLPEGATEVFARARAAAAGGASARTGASDVSPRVQAMVRDVGRLGGSTQRALLEVLAGGDASQAIARAGLGKKERAGLLSAVLRGTERAERSSLLEQAGGSDFAFAWLARVDGTRSGLDIGLGDTRAEFGRTFGKRRDSTLAGASPVQGASLITPTRSSQVEDKSGLRAVAAQFVHTSTGAARPQHGASDAMRRTDWRFVDTGSRASTGGADLGKLAAAIVGNSETARRAPMPLVAPAAKAVAQTALRKSTREAVASGRGGRGGRGGGAKPPAEAKMSEQAIESLAIEMATRVARLMGLMKERIGVW